MCFQVWPSNSTGDLLDSLDDLLASGDASAALFVLDIVAGGLGGDESVNIDITVVQYPMIFFESFVQRNKF